MSLHKTSLTLGSCLLFARLVGQNVGVFRKWRLLLVAVLSTVSGLSLASDTAVPAFLAGTVYEDVARSEGVDPSMLYALALVESGKMVEGSSTHVAPWPYVLRAVDARYYAEDASDYRIAFQLFQEKYGDRFDVGPLQVNVYWQVTRAERLESAKALLDFETNLRTGARVLKEAMKSTKDKALGIGRYHTWSDDERARLFGERVLTVHQNLTQGN